MKLLIIAGEESGDLHASNLCKSLLQLNPEIQLIGSGGQRMQDAGVTLLHNLVERAVVGFWEPIKQLGFFKKLMLELEQDVAKQKPEGTNMLNPPSQPAIQNRPMQPNQASQNYPPPGSTNYPPRKSDFWNFNF